MKFLRRKSFWFGGVALLLILAAVFFSFKIDLGTQLAIGAGYKAKILCSGVFLSGREKASLLEEDIPIHPLLNFIKARVDEEEEEVTASFLGLFKARAVFHPRLGAVLLSGVPEGAVRGLRVDLPAAEPAEPETVPWPIGDLLPGAPTPPGVDLEGLERTLDRAFEEPRPERPVRTRAVIVVQDGRLLAERYAPGITPETPLIGWSMSKSVTSALAGILVGQGKLSLSEPVDVPEWSRPGDPRAAITLDHLLTMSSGLVFDEEYATKPVSDVNMMLYLKPDMAAFAADFPLEAEPGAKWSYSSGTTSIISRLIRQAFDEQDEYLAFPRQVLFNRIGMRSAVFETDASGTFVGAAYVYATARDWARFGLLFLNDGLWEGERVLPEGWVAYTVTPVSCAPRGCYGAQFWLNRGSEGDPTDRDYPKLPEDLFLAQGYQGQYIAILPSRRLVVVRLGMTTKGEWDLQAFLLDILKAVS